MCRSHTQTQNVSKNNNRSRPRPSKNKNFSKKNQNKKYVHNVDVGTTQMTDSDDFFDDFLDLSFSTIVIDSLQQDDRDEVFTKINIKVPGHPSAPGHLTVKVDTGAQGNCLPLRIFQKMCPNQLDADGYPAPGSVLQTGAVLSAYNQTTIKQLGLMHIPCQYADSAWYDLGFYIADVKGPAILGLPSSRQLKLVTFHCEIGLHLAPQPSVNSVQDLLSQHPEQFDRVGHFPGKYHIVVDKDVLPVVHAPRKCPIQMKSEIEAELESMKQQGIIRKVDEPTDWVSSLVYSRKSNGSLRVCLDPKDLNKAIKRCHHRSPTLEEITHHLSGASVFSKLDAKNGYWSVELDQESQLLTTFNSPFGRHCFTRMPFGLVMSQDVFQQHMDRILEKCPGTIGIADDVVVYGRDDSEHDANLRRLMEVASGNGLVFNSQKCMIKQSSINFFGLVLDRDGAHPDPNKVADMQSMSVPQDIAQLQCFLGVATYMAPFVPNLSHHTAPLRDILKQNEFHWTDSCQQSFEKIKSLICAQQTLAYFDPNKPSVIQVDASSRGLGAALLQDDKPVIFASKALTPAETRYANIERELLAVVFGCQRFHTFIYGKPFVVESDHKPLEMISLKNLEAAPPRLQRMLLKIHEYDVTIIYRPGKQMTLPDSLSRLPNQQNDHQIDLDVRVDFVQFSTNKLDELRRETKADPELRALETVITKGWPSRHKELHSSLRPYWAYRDELSVENGLLLKGSRILIPTCLQRAYLDKIHSGHQGREMCKLRAKSCVFWNGINEDINNVVSRCNVCQKYQRTQTVETLEQHELPTRPWQVVGTDLFQFDGDMYLIIADYYSKFQFVRKVPKPASSEQVIRLTKQLFSEHGIPAQVISDNGGHFSSSAYTCFAESWGFEHVTSSPHYPRSNGFVERCVQTVKNTLKKAKEGKMDPYMALLSLRTTPVDHHIPSPAELLYTRKIQGNLPVRLENRIACKDQIYDRLRVRQNKQKHYHDRKAHDLQPLCVGQTVRVQDPVSQLWQPAEVTAVRDEPRSYIVSTDQGQQLRRNRQHIRSVPRPIGLEGDNSRAPEQSSVQRVNQHSARAPSPVTNGYTTKSGRVSKKPARYHHE
jgi:transposase InsO family protein